MMRFSLLCCLFLFAFGSMSAQMITKTVKDFGAKGNGKTNDHEAFLKAADWINSRGGNAKLVIPKGTYIVGKQGTLPDGTKENNVISLINCKNVVIEGRSAIIKFADGLKFGAFDPATGKPFFSKKEVFADYKYASPIGNFIQVVNCDNITICKIEINGNHQTFILGGKYGDTGFQLTHDGILIKNSSNLLISDLYIHHMGRDGIQIGNATPDGTNTKNQNIKVTNCRLEYNGRQGMSWVGGVGLRVSKCKFNYTGRGKFVSAPAAGCDVEAEVGIIKDGVFDDCEFVDNYGCCFVADSGESSDITLNNCTFWGINNWSIWVTKPRYRFNNCTVHGSIVHGYDSPNKKDATYFYKCNFEDKDLKGKPSYGTFIIEVNYVKRITFDQCTFTANDKKLFWIVGSDNYSLDEQPLFDKCKLVVKKVKYKFPDYYHKVFMVKYKDVDLTVPVTYADSDILFVSGSNVKIIGDFTIHYTDKKRIIKE